jgi:hypothetical protein
MRYEEKALDHVDRLNSLSKLEKEGFEGLDIDIGESVFGYGVVWKKIPEINAILFVYRIDDGLELENRYDRSYIDINTDVEEWDWVDFEEVANFVGLSKKEWLESDLVFKVINLLSYYGYRNVFGESQWEGFRIKSN